ncbi:MAG: hypothetical protein GEU94_09485 [Micromonosporaceae bacterium]|nr:hypothetical protein [Micromonosporaceae bacterium]
MDTRIEERSLQDQDEVVCASCGRTEHEPPLTWSRQAARRGSSGPAWLCDSCTRENLREIEAKLDDIW